jgi:rhamnogalacturonan endolyase
MVAGRPVHIAAQGNRALWASIANKVGKNELTTNNSLKAHYNKVLVSWRMLPGDDATGFDLYRRIGNGIETKLNGSTPITTSTNWQDAALTTFTSDVTYRLTYAGSTTTLDTYTISAAQLSGRLPYISIPLKSTEDVYAGDDLEYQANDVSVGDLDGDGQYEIVVKRLQSPKGQADGGTGAGYSSKSTIYAVIWDAYKLDGTFLWRIKGGPGIILGNSSSFAIADFDGDGCAEMAIRTCEGTVFGDGYEIPDTDGDGIIDYRTWDNYDKTGDARGWMDNYNSAGPEFISIIDGKTGRELARADFIDRETSASWGDNYWKRACSFRVGVGCFDETCLPSAVFGRGVYARSVIEAWDWRNGQLTKKWRFDTNDKGTGKDGQKHSTYAGQGNHSLNVADLDGDGLDEVMYGSMAVDDDGIGLWNTGLGHGDANHVGKFLPDREGLQMYHCLEGGTTMVALHDAADGSVIWQKDAASSNDMGRCLVGDFFPEYPGCEFFYYQGNYIMQDGTETTINTKGQKGGCGMAVWFDGTLSRQLIEDNIIQSPKNGRIFTMYRFSETFINGTKSNPAWYGDLLGDWREEIIVPDGTLVGDLKIFSTWFPTDHKFPWLMTDHTYLMSALNENIGYNQPTNLGYYLGTDLTSDAEAWVAASNAPGVKLPATVSVTLNAEGLATLSSSQPLDFSGVDGLSAYIIEGVATDKAVLTPVDLAPAATGLILRGTPNAQYSIPVATQTVTTDVSGNLLRTTILPTTVSSSSAYVLNGSVLRPYSGTLIPAGKAYLPKSAASSRQLLIDFDAATGINDATLNNKEKFIKDCHFFNLQGQRVSTPTKGIYVVAGRKAIIK